MRRALWSTPVSCLPPLPRGKVGSSGAAELMDRREAIFKHLYPCSQDCYLGRPGLGIQFGIALNGIDHRSLNADTVSAAVDQVGGERI
jgi:hypothetical protein